MTLEKLLKEDRTLKELYNAGFRYHDQHEGFKILIVANGARYYFTKQKGLYHFEFMRPKDFEYYSKNIIPRAENNKMRM